MRRLRICLWSKAIVALGMIASLQFPTTARAALDLVITIDGTPQQFISPAATDQDVGYTFGGVNIIASATGNAPNPGGGTARLLGSTLSLVDLDGGTHTVQVVVSDTGYLSPTAPPSLVATSSLGGTSTEMGASGLSIQGYINQDNGLNSTTGFSPGLQTTYSSGNVGSGGSSSFNLTPASTVISSLSSSYSMTTVINLTISGSAVVNFTSTLSMTSAVPEPSTMALTSLGSLGLIVYGLRRRKAFGAARVQTR